MKKLALISLVLLGACSQISKPKTQHVIDTSQAMPYVFVVSSASGTYVEDTLTLKPVPIVVYFSDRPHLVAGHIGLKEFIQKWSEVKETSSDDTPNAVLSILAHDKPKEFPLELSKPVFSDGQLKVKVLSAKGKIPTNLEANSIFIEMKGLNIDKNDN